MGKSHIKLEKWFWAIYLVINDRRGYSATALQKQLDISMALGGVSIGKAKVQTPEERAAAKKELRAILRSNGVIKDDDKA